jgi:uncharacterized protein YciI
MKQATSIMLMAITIAAATVAAYTEEPAEKKYEMMTYYVGFLRRGPAWTPEVTPETQKIQEGHMANIRRMAAEGKLLLAGPFSDDGELRGMYVFTTATIEEAKALAAEDPAVKAGRLVLDFHPWFSAKGIRIDPCPAAGK